MNFYLATYDFPRYTEKRIDDTNYMSRSAATNGLEAWCAKSGVRNTGKYFVGCELSDWDLEALLKVPEPREMLLKLQEAGPEAVHRAARRDGFTSLLNVMGATNKYGTPLAHGGLLWELGEIDATPLERATIRCALCVSCPYSEFWSSYFLPSYKYLDKRLRACVRAAMEHI